MSETRAGGEADDGTGEWWQSPSKPARDPGEPLTSYASRIRAANSARRDAGLAPWPASTGAASSTARSARGSRTRRYAGQVGEGEARESGSAQARQGQEAEPGIGVSSGSESGVEAEQVSYGQAARGVADVGGIERLDLALGKLTQLGFQFTGKVRLSSFKRWLRAQGINPETLRYADIWTLQQHEVRAWGSALSSCVEAMPKRSAIAVKSFLKHQAPWVTLLFVSWMSIYQRIEHEELSRIAILEAIRGGGSARPGARSAGTPAASRPAATPGAVGAGAPPISNGSKPGGGGQATGGITLDDAGLGHGDPADFIPAAESISEYEAFYRGIGPSGS